jgi:hypothetical protein
VWFVILSFITLSPFPLSQETEKKCLREKILIADALDKRGANDPAKTKSCCDYKIQTLNLIDDGGEENV